MRLPQAESCELRDGRRIPAVGLGVWQAAPAECHQAVLWALEAGYRHVDTARIYGNEREVGRALRDSGVPREEVFVTTKLWNSDQGYDRALKAFDESAKDLGLDYVDLYLVHFPVTRTRKEAWRALERLHAEGRARSIGVSNYTERHLEELRRESDVLPAVNQVELHPFLYQKDLLDYCRRHGIVVEAYSPLAHGERISDPRIGRIAEAYGRSNAQVMIRWALQHGTVVLPKSVHKARIAENLAVFDFTLTDEDMARLDALNESYRTCWDPSEVP